MNWDAIADVVSAIAMLGGSALVLTAGIGAVVLPDLLARIHAATKPQVLGVILALLGLVLRLRDFPTVWMLALAALFALLTAPVSGHMLGRVGLRTGKVAPEDLVIDELSEDLRNLRSSITEHDEGQS